MANQVRPRSCRVVWMSQILSKALDSLATRRPLEVYLICVSRRHASRLQRAGWAYLRALTGLPVHRLLWRRLGPLTILATELHRLASTRCSSKSWQNGYESKPIFESHYRSSFSHPELVIGLRYLRMWWWKFSQLVFAKMCIWHVGCLTLCLALCLVGIRSA